MKERKLQQKMKKMEAMKRKTTIHREFEKSWAEHGGLDDESHAYDCSLSTENYESTGDSRVTEGEMGSRKTALMTMMTKMMKMKMMLLLRKMTKRVKQCDRSCQRTVVVGVEEDDDNERHQEWHLRSCDGRGERRINWNESDEESEKGEEECCSSAVVGVVGVVCWEWAMTWVPRSKTFDEMCECWSRCPDSKRRKKQKWRKRWRQQRWHWCWQLE